jgi:uncharacterized membrane protein
MEFMTEKKNVYTLSNDALDMVNSHVQFHTVSNAILFGLLTLLIVVIIFKN